MCWLCPIITSGVKSYTTHPFSSSWTRTLNQSFFPHFFSRYLRYSRREFDYWQRGSDSNLYEEVKRNEVQKELFKNVFLIVMRMGDHKESSTDFMTTEYYAKLVYDNFIFDIPKMLDVAALYSSYNVQAISDLLHRLFKVVASSKISHLQGTTQIYTRPCALRYLYCQSFYRNPKAIVQKSEKDRFWRNQLLSHWYLVLSEYLC